VSQLTDYALTRLRSLLPLAERQRTLSPELQKVHRSILQSLVHRGRPLNLTECGRTAAGYDAATAILMLASVDLVVVDSHGNPAGAYPLTTVTTPFEVTVDGNTIWAMCALDAVSVAPTFDVTATIRSRCPVTGISIDITMQGNRIVETSPGTEPQVGVWWRDPGPVAAQGFCPGVVFLRDAAAASQWQAGRMDHEFVSLVDAVEIGERFFRPLLESRPELVEA